MKQIFKKTMAFLLVLCMMAISLPVFATEPATLPTAYDLRNDGYLTSVKSQGLYGGCWAFGSVGAMESNMLRNGLGSYDLSELALQYFVYHNVNDPMGNIGNDTAFSKSAAGRDFLTVGGDTGMVAYHMMTWVGPVSEESVPYENAETVRANGLDASYAYNQTLAHLQNFFYVPVSDSAAIKQAILQYGGLATTFTDGTIYADHAYNQATAAYYNSERAGYGHAVVIAGWDDDYPISNFDPENQPPIKGAWLIKDSMGDDYGQDGFFWASYADPDFGADSTRLAAVFDMESADNYDHNYQYDGGMQQAGYSAGNTTQVYAANVFTAGGDETLDAVSFDMSYYTDMDYDITVYVNPVNPNEPSSGTVAAQVSGTTGYRGYYTVPLTTPVSLKKGDVFAVQLHYKESDGTCIFDETFGIYFDMDASYNGFADIGFTAGGQRGQSFVRFSDQYMWQDLQDLKNANLRIKAYTTDVDGDCTVIGHNYRSTVTQPTCTAAGVITNTCTRCGDSYTETGDAALGHNYKTVVTAPTCYEGGYTTYTCTRCSTSYQGDATEALGHNLISTVYAPDCISEGYTLYSCTRCYYRYPGSFTDALGHDYEMTEYPATCTDPGFRTYTCLRCDDVYYEDIPALKHNYVPVVTKPTATEEGYTTYTCANCGDSYATDYVPATGIVEPTEPTATTVQFGRAIRLGSTINLNIIVDGAPDSASPIPTTATNVKATVWHLDENGDKADIVESDITLGAANTISYDKLSAYALQTTVYAQVTYTDNGVDYISQEYSTSAAAYCAAQLAKAPTGSNNNLRRLMADLLNYGSAAQVSYNVDIDTLANKDITAYQSEASAANPEMADVSAITGTGVAVGASLSLKSRVEVKYQIPRAQLTANGLTLTAENSYLRVTRRDTGAYVDVALSGEEEIAYNFYYAGLSAFEFDVTLDAVLYIDGAAVSKTRTYSVNSYLTKNVGSADANLASLCSMLSRYGAAAKIYVDAPSV